MLNLVLWTVLTEVLIVPHETAHVGTALALGVRVFEVQLGDGPRLAQWRVRGLTVGMHAVPFTGGHTVLGFATRSLFKTKMLLATAAGPAVHLVFVAPWLSGHWHVQWSSLLAEPAVGPAFILANAWLFALNAWPGTPSRPSDGQLLLRTPFLPEPELDEMLGSYPVMEAIAARNEGRLEDALAWLDRARPAGAGMVAHLLERGMVLALLGRNAAARDSFQQAREAGGEDGPLGPTLWNNIAWADTMLGDPTLLEEAETLSTRAVEAAPWLRAIKGTHGAVLVWKTAYQEAIPFLREALADSDELHPMAHATYRAALCLALTALGEQAAAAQELARGEAACPTCVLLIRARAAVDAAP